MKLCNLHNETHLLKQDLKSILDHQVRVWALNTFKMMFIYIYVMKKERIAVGKKRKQHTDNDS